VFFDFEDYVETDPTMLILLLEQLYQELDKNIELFTIDSFRDNFFDKDDGDLFSPHEKHSNNLKTRSITFMILDKNSEDDANQLLLKRRETSSVSIRWQVAINRVQVFVKPTTRSLWDQETTFNLSEMPPNKVRIFKKNFGILFGKINKYRSQERKRRQRDNMVETLNTLFPNIFDSLILGVEDGQEDK